MTVRCRMAPSPTGKLHVGTAHTALFNFLYTRRHQGQFILRIDDSDPERSKPEFTADIIENLKWLGITWDEGPDVGGNYGPYHQSERTAIYQKYLDQLLSQHKAYRCFCAKETLEAKRAEAESQKRTYKYDGTCRNLSQVEIEKNLAEHISYVIRLINPNKRVAFDDLVRGHIEVDSSDFGDFIITRSDGTVLLNLAVVIDDIEMKITHAVRGEDFLNATPYQILICEALDATPPLYANLSFIYAADHTKLSKRHGATGVSEYKEQGYLPEAMLNFLALLGWNPGTDQELFTLPELIAAFDFDKVGKSMPTFNFEKLNWFNGQYIRQKSDDQLLQLVKPFMKNPDTNIDRILPLVKERLVKLSDIDVLIEPFFTSPTYDPNLWPNPDNSHHHLLMAKEKLASVTWEKTAIDTTLVEEVKARGWKNGDFFMSMRIAIYGSKFTPPLTDTMLVLGQVQSLQRITNAVTSLEVSN